MSNKYTGWRNAFSIYPDLYLRKSLVKPLVLWVPSLIVYFGFGSTDAFSMLGWMADFVKSSYPSILGFILTGHALIVGFSGSDFILHLAKERKDSKTTLLQDINSTFTMVIASLVVTFIFAAAVSFAIRCDLPCWNYSLAVGFNNFVFVVFLFLFFYSLCSLLDVVISIFNLGQASNIIARGKIKKMQESKTTENCCIDKLINYFKGLF